MSPTTNSSSSSDKDPVLDYNNWVEWSEYWRGYLRVRNFWQYTDPETDVVLPPPTTTINRDIDNKAQDAIIKLRQHVSPDCRKLLGESVTLRDTWKALKAGCDRGLTLPLVGKMEAFFAHKWETKDTIGTYVTRLRNLYLSIENTEFAPSRNAAVHILISRLPDCYRADALNAEQADRSFIDVTAYLLANIKETTTTGDNRGGTALVHRTRHPQRGRGNKSSRGSGSRGRGATGRGRGPGRPNRHNSPHIICNWCQIAGHLERDCQIKRRQLADGTAQRNYKGKAYLLQPSLTAQSTPNPTNYAPVNQPNISHAGESRTSASGDLSADE